MTAPTHRGGRGRRARRSSLVWAAAIAVMGALLVTLLLVPIVRQGSVREAGTLVDSPAPALDAEDLDGERHALTAPGRRLTWVNFWATWCPPCRTEMPAMQALADRYGDELLILGVDWGEERSAVEDFVERYGISYPILLDPSLDDYYRWSPQFGLPRHYFVGPDGTVLREVIGELPPDRMAEILDEMLGPPSAGNARRAPLAAADAAVAVS